MVCHYLHNCRADVTAAPPSHFIYAHPTAITTLAWARFPVADPEGNLLLDQPTPYLLSGSVDPNIMMHDMRDSSAIVFVDKYIRCKSVYRWISVLTCLQSHPHWRGMACSTFRSRKTASISCISSGCGRSRRTRSIGYSLSRDR
jgi:hypothetical protein